MTETATRQITLRLPEPLYQTAIRLARRQQLSVSRLARQSLERLVEEELAREMQMAYDALGADAQESDVEPFLAAQSEAVWHDPA